MNKKILGFGGSNSANSINKTLASYVSYRIEDVNVTIADLNDYIMPLYSIDLETQNGIPQQAYEFEKLIKEADGIVLSLAEHNGLPSASFKNLSDWMSRIDPKVWKDKPIMLMATSPGERGGASVLGIMKGLMPYAGGNVVSDFSLPSFYDNFSENGIQDEGLKKELFEKIKIFENEINKN
ncbi:NADPH-dependent FMN reductase [Marinifilum breve]|uniref:NADPH-dependent FMN reductase n=1 Tax=Marinifilum breve TaxID=2184082 RepID=A0A2V3ZZY2_9BACT|nr:NAD(P)H-dependent oxidoreductase [Marinifilum breve]PXY02042.1 NADPH-dependent FMN reductase [Marinifilum breve]